MESECEKLKIMRELNELQAVALEKARIYLHALRDNHIYLANTTHPMPFRLDDVLAEVEKTCGIIECQFIPENIDCELKEAVNGNVK
jgi:hypothetical protein